MATAKPVSSWRKLVAQFRDPLIYLLLAAIVTSVEAWKSSCTTSRRHTWARC